MRRNTTPGTYARLFSYNMPGGIVARSVMACRLPAARLCCPAARDHVPGIVDGCQAAGIVAAGVPGSYDRNTCPAHMPVKAKNQPVTAFYMSMCISILQPYFVPVYGQNKGITRHAGGHSIPAHFTGARRARRAAGIVAGIAAQDHRQDQPEGVPGVTGVTGVSALETSFLPFLRLLRFFKISVDTYIIYVYTIVEG